VADLVRDLLHQHVGQLQQSGQLPQGVCYTFDLTDATVDQGLPNHDQAIQSTVQKTVRRTVTTLAHGTFQARETIRQGPPEKGSSTRRSEELARLVPAGCRYGYDLIAHVGLESFLHGRRLSDMQRQFAAGQPSIEVPLSTLDELRRKFLFYLGQVHRQATVRLAESLREQGPVAWLIDGTIEPGTPVFFGIYEARLRMLLGAWKMPTENSTSITPALREAAGQFGVPDSILHDLSRTMSAACEEALAGVPHGVCHFHFARDVGDDLYQKPQTALTKRLRALKLQVRLREQRKTQTAWLRTHCQRGEASRLLDGLLRGEPPQCAWNETLGREVLLAFHFWMLDYAADGTRQGYPFDPHVLYLHRRLVRGQVALARLLSRGTVSACAPQALHNLREQLEGYVQDAEIVSAARHYEMAAWAFSRLREALRLSAADTNPMRAAYRLESGEGHEVMASLAALREELRERSRGGDEIDREVCTIVLTHVDKYWPQLLPTSGGGHRTTNDLESHWGMAKRGCRHTQGGRKLTRTFEALPAELMLVPNLENPHYVEIVFGSLDQLAEKFSEAPSTGIRYSAWRRDNGSLNLGRLPRRTLRRENFLEDLMKTYDAQCKAKASRVA
jgi:hypothetical protein